MVKMAQAVWTDSDATQAFSAEEDVRSDERRPLPPAAPVHPEFAPLAPAPSPAPEIATPPQPEWQHGWPVPSTISPHPDEARGGILLPEFDALIVEKARVISGRFPNAEAEYRSQRSKRAEAEELEI